MSLIKLPLYLPHLLLLFTFELILFLAVQGKLESYVHPRFHWFTIGMALVGIVIVILQWIERPKPQQAPASVLLAAIWIVLLVVGYGFQPAAFSARDVAKRSGGGIYNNSTTSADGKWCNYSKDGTATAKPTSFSGWQMVIDGCQTPSQFNGTPVELVGFVSQSNDRSFVIARFFMGCCAIDTTPLIFTVNSSSKPRVDSWVKVKGTWRMDEITPPSTNEYDKRTRFTYSIDKPVVQPTDRPESIYEYYGIDKAVFNE